MPHTTAASSRLLGTPEAVAAGVIKAVGKAAELIDLRRHQGEHPRIGATDVIPFVPIAGMTIEECVALSERVAAEIADRYGIPVYLYEQSARVTATSGPCLHPQGRVRRSPGRDIDQPGSQA